MKRLTITICLAPVIPNLCPQQNQVMRKTSIAFSITDRNSANQLFTISADGNNKKQISNVRGRACGPDWSHDGKKIAFYNHFNEQTWSLFIMDSDGKNVKQLTDSVGIWDACPRWAPDGSKIVFCRTYPKEGYKEEIWVIDPDGSNPHRIGSVSGSGPCWSRDGEKILYTSWIGSANEIFVMNSDGTNQSQITQMNSEIYWPKWSPDGNKIIFQSNKDGDQEIYIMNSDGSNVKQLTFNDTDDSTPDWSPDGNEIIFVSNRTGNHELFVMNSEDTNQTKITDTEIHAIQPDWKPGI